MKITCEFCSKRRTRLAGGESGRSRASALRALVVVAAAASASGCAAIGAKPWQHNLLAEQAMQVDPYPLETAIDEHIYFSKEASSGGRSFAGGGCGCN